MKVQVVLSGYGTVGREFIKLLNEKYLYINESYGIDLVVSAVLGRNVAIHNEDGLSIHHLLMYGGGSAAIEEYIEHHPEERATTSISGTVLVESTVTNLKDGNPGKQYIKQAIEKHMDIVAISKGALVTNWREINEAAKIANVRIRYSGATAAALPTLDIGQFSLAGCHIEKIEGILNGTTNYILSKMNEEDITFEEALKEAQSKGIAETNPILDVSGSDSACKLLLLVNSLMGTENTLTDIHIKGIEHVTKQQIRNAKEQNKYIKLIASAYKDKDGKVALHVEPYEIDKDHPLAKVNGTEKGITFFTDTMGQVTTIGGASNPRGAAAAALKDVINLYRKDLSLSNRQ
ncbi:homoserine dehydrogenase [Bacillus wiedmannii]|uniref:Homoserine dehydrogenase n=1 Tax=Bacillus wiedmannii TaxID=1890302 RepID=A0A2C4PSP6_9BACI|nr:homoserine dehydrogenase [Bacillus wiedmannii]KPU52731.1 homoserine dehydrogenase, NAD binding domain protein [Bacillus wiedmannii]PHD55837.1 homoserine dehydrogenase [Bacillus wiedmannii]PRT31355.1 homoserine dehydrogenase [Bacillus wiedmannii]PRT43602.1 homoserine dehydrogenase [Bacillus wiedmannii]